MRGLPAPGSPIGAIDGIGPNDCPAGLPWLKLASIRGVVAPTTCARKRSSP